MRRALLLLALGACGGGKREPARGLDAAAAPAPVVEIPRDAGPVWASDALATPVRAVLAPGAHADLDACYELLRGAGDPRFVVLLRPDGTVADVDLPPAAGERTATCLDRALASLNFPPPGGAATTAVRFELPPPPPPLDAAPAHVDQDLQEEARRYADILFAESDDDTSGTMAKIAEGSDLGQQLSDIRDHGADVAVGGGGGATARMGESVGPGVVDAGAAAPQPKATVTVEVLSDGGDPEAATRAAAKIRAAYLGSIRRCAKTSPFLGTFTLAVTISDSGRADVRADGGDDAGTCAAKSGRHWRFEKHAADVDLELRATVEIVSP